MANKKLNGKQLKDAQKLQKIVEHFETKSLSEAQAERKLLFKKVAPKVSKERAIQLRAAQDAANDQTLIQLSPNPLADMCTALHRCFQCGTKLTANEIRNAAVIHKPGLIVVCQECLILLREWENGNHTTPAFLPYAASVQCAEDYEKFTKTYN